MPMTAVALAFYAVLIAITFGVRVAVQLRRTGSTGVVGLRSGAPPLEWIAGALFIAGAALGALSPALVLANALDPVSSLDCFAGHLIVTILALLGVGLTFGAQMAMGDAWRIGVEYDQ